MIYLDHAASSPLAPGVYEAMEPWLKDNYGNPSALHTPGRKARQAIENARERIARILDCEAHEIIFTSGGTEANNLVLHQFAAMRSPRIIVSAIEHDSIRASGHQFFNVSLLAVDRDGLVDLQQLPHLLTAGTVLVSVMAVNNEIGTIQPVKEISKICKGYEFSPVFFHVDAVQAVGHIPLSVSSMGCDSISLSAHKFGGPKGIGVLCVNQYLADCFEPLLRGGGQEHGLRSGTENVAGIVGMATALEHAEANRIEREAYYETLFNVFMRLVQAQLPDVRLNGSAKHRTLSNINIMIPGVEAEAVLLMLDLAGICASAGSACSASGNKPSHVLKAIGLTDEEARSSLRLTMGPETTPWDMRTAAEKLVKIVRHLRSV